MQKEELRIALVGATGLVGQMMATVLREHGYQECQLLPVASPRSVGKPYAYGERELQIMNIEQAVGAKPHIALLAAGSEISKQWAPRLAQVGTRVVDNSSAWRLDPKVPLIVPEVNPQALQQHHRIIANPNCSTIQLLVAMAPLHRAFGLEAMHISTYQAVSGSGMRGIAQLQAERDGHAVDNPAYPRTIDRNCLPHCDAFLPNGYTKEEMKLVDESRKILALPELRVSATAVRVPVVGAHSEAVSALFSKPVTVNGARQALSEQPGLRLYDSPELTEYPTALQVQGQDQVWVGRIREDLVSPGYGLNLWVVADNIRKGAATNAVQIVDMLVERGYL